MSTTAATEGKKKIKRGFLAVITGRTFVVVILLAAQVLVLLWGIEKLGEFIHLGSVLASALMLIYILNTRSNPTVKLTWCFVVAVMPVLGIPLYFFIKLDVGHREVQKSIARCVAETKPYFTQVSDPQTVEERLEASDPDAASIAAYLGGYNGFPAYTGSEVTYFPIGEKKFAAMLEELEKAESFIFMEYFIVSHGHMWDQILEVLTRKAKAGVDVRFMYDGTCAFSDIPYSFPEEIEALGIRCKVFAPVRPFVSTHYNYRDHRKILVVDGKVAFTGGVNLADEYINEKVRFGHWKDTAIMVRGEAVRSFTLMFLQMWNATGRETGCSYEKFLPDTASVSVPEARGVVIPYGDSPMDDERVGEMVYLHLINTARRYLYVMTPYLILDGETLTALLSAAKRGVDVRIILPHIPDKKYAFWLAKSHYAELVEAGVKIYEYTPGFMHAKVFLKDDTMGVVGTVNLDFRSFYHHFECAALLAGVPALEDVKADFADTLEKSQRVTEETIAHEKFHVKLFGRILKIVAPLM